MHHLWHVAALILALVVLSKQDRRHEWYKGGKFKSSRTRRPSGRPRGTTRRVPPGGGRVFDTYKRPGGTTRRVPPGGGRVFDTYKRPGGSATRRVPPGGGRVFDTYKRPGGTA